MGGHCEERQRVGQIGRLGLTQEEWDAREKNERLTAAVKGADDADDAEEEARGGQDCEGGPGEGHPEDGRGHEHVERVWGEDDPVATVATVAATTQKKQQNEATNAAASAKAAVATQDESATQEESAKEKAAGTLTGPATLFGRRGAKTAPVTDADG